jgi:hypothetical protein
MKSRNQKSESNARVAKFRATQKLQKEIARLELEVEQIPAEIRYKSSTYGKLVDAWNKLNPDSRASTEHPDALKISGSDATVRGVYYNTAKDDGLEHQAPVGDDSRGFGYGVLAESPEQQGIRDNCPEWVRDASLLKKFHDLLLSERLEEFPAMQEEQTVFTIADVNLLKAYYLENWPFSALQNVTNRWNDLSSFRELDEPDEETVAELQKRLRTLTNDGYRLLKLTRPTAEVLKREPREVREILEAKAQYGRGTDLRYFERNLAKPDYDQARELAKEYRRLGAADAARQASLSRVTPKPSKTRVNKGDKPILAKAAAIYGERNNIPPDSGPTPTRSPNGCVFYFGKSATDTIVVSKEASCL